MANTLYDDINNYRLELLGKKAEIARLMKVARMIPGMQPFAAEMEREFSGLIDNLAGNLGDILLKHPEAAPRS